MEGEHWYEVRIRIALINVQPPTSKFIVRIRKQKWKNRPKEDEKC